ncbi:hypothetical protein DIPPA_22732 [Diplonema papillatum]|nr:hypothetical protein DIPPA_22732 [Diplonema papillatum]
MADRVVLWMDGQGTRGTAVHESPRAKGRLERAKKVKEWKAMLGLIPSEPEEPAVKPPTSVSKRRRREERQPPTPDTPLRQPAQASVATQHERQRVRYDETTPNSHICNRCTLLIPGGERRALSHWISSCLKQLAARAPPEPPLANCRQFPPVDVDCAFDREGNVISRTVATQERLGFQSFRQSSTKQKAPLRKSFSVSQKTLRRFLESGGTSDEFAVNVMPPSTIQSLATTSPPSSGRRSSVDDFMVHIMTPGATVVSSAGNDDDEEESEKRMSMLCEELAAADAQLQSLVRVSMEQLLTLTESMALLEKQLANHSVQRPPRSIQVFDIAEVRAIHQYVIATYFRHYKLYLYCFTPPMQLCLKASHFKSQVSQPREFKPLHLAAKCETPRAAVSEIEEDTGSKQEETPRPNAPEAVSDGDAVSPPKAVQNLPQHTSLKKQIEAVSAEVASLTTEKLSSLEDRVAELERLQQAKESGTKTKKK